MNALATGEIAGAGIDGPAPRGGGDFGPGRAVDTSASIPPVALREPDEAAAVGPARQRSREERFTELYRAHALRVARVIAAAVRPQDRDNVVDDLAQEAFLRVWVSLEALPQEDEGAGRYIAAIARNRVRSHYRDLARLRAREAPAGPVAPVWGSSAAAATDDPLAGVDEFDAHLAVIRALNDGLPDEVAQVLRARFWQNQEITEVAERIGRSRATTVRRQAEGLALLRERLATARATAYRADRHQPGAARSDAALDRARRTVARAEQQRTGAAQRAADRATLPAAAPEVTLRDYGATRLRPAMRGLTEGGAGQYRAGWRQRVLPTLGDLPLHTIDAATVDHAMRSWTAENIASSTLRGARAALTRVLDEAVAEGLLAHNPAREADRQTPDRASCLDPAEVGHDQDATASGADSQARSHRRDLTGNRSIDADGAQLPDREHGPPSRVDSPAGDVAGTSRESTGEIPQSRPPTDSICQSAVDGGDPRNGERGDGDAAELPTSARVEHRDDQLSPGEGRPADTRSRDAQSPTSSPEGADDAAAGAGGEPDRPNWPVETGDGLAVTRATVAEVTRRAELGQRQTAEQARAEQLAAGTPTITPPITPTTATTSKPTAATPTVTATTGRAGVWTRWPHDHANDQNTTS